MIVLGADLSWTRTGLVWLNDCFQVVRHSAFAIKPGPKRFYRAIKLLTAELSVQKPDLCVIEDNAYSAGGRVVLVKLSALNTLLKASCEAANIEWLEVSPSMAKKFATGKGSSDKDQVAQELERKYGIKFNDDKGRDLSDGACLAAWGLCHRGKAP